MPQILWDASALVKRYLIESGSDTVDALWTAPAISGAGATYLGYLETAAILRRRRNAGALGEVSFSAARFLLQREVLNNADFQLQTVDATLLDAIRLIDRHNINASDAAILSAFLHFARSSRETCLLVAADQRLLRAAAAEGLATLNPETMAAADVSAFLTSQ